MTRQKRLEFGVDQLPEGFKRTPEYREALADGRIRLKPTDDEQAQP